MLSVRRVAGDHEVRRWKLPEATTSGKASGMHRGAVSGIVLHGNFIFTSSYDRTIGVPPRPSPRI